MAMTDNDFTPNGLRIEGPYENDPHAQSRDLFKAIIHEVYGATDCIIAHHLTYVAVDKRDGFDYQVVEEIPSADALIFDHEVAKKIWGPEFGSILQYLAAIPVPQRDEELERLYYGRGK